MPLAERDAGWLAHASVVRPGETLEHPAVVLRALPHGWLLVHGTTTPRDREGRPLTDAELLPAAPPTNAFWIDPDSHDGRALGLSARTYFCRTAATLCRNERDLRVTGRCPPALFLELRLLVGLRA